MSTYRPQFAFPSTPLGFRDDQFTYNWDGTTVPTLAGNLAAGATTNNILLPTQADAPFIARGLKIRTGASDSTLWFQLKTPRGDYMQTVPVPIALYASKIDGAAIAGRYLVPFDSEIEAPASSIWTLYLYNPTGGSVALPSVSLVGVKRCSLRRAA